MSRRLPVLLLLFALLGSFIALSVMATPQTEAAAAVTTNNPVTVENKLPGAKAWQIPWPGKKLGDDVGKQVKGYTTASSVNRGGQLGFKVTVNPAQKFQISIFRLGYYQGLGARRVVGSTWKQGTVQRACPVSVATGLIACDWSTSWTVAVRDSWTSGLYLAVLTNQRGYQNYVPFVVRDDTRKATGLVVEPFNTYAAYNQYPYDNKTGKNMYGGWGPIVTGSGQQRAVKSSFDRPFHGNGSGRTFQGPSAMTRWMEQQGYDVTYAVSEDLHTGRVNLNNFRLYVSPGHDEYWSVGMYDRLQAALDKGTTNFAFMAANNIYWQIRYESSAKGVPNRVIVCYRSRKYDPVKTGKVTLRWRDLGRPEQLTLGAMYVSMVKRESTDLVKSPTHFMFNGTNMKVGSAIPQLIAGEADFINPGVGLPKHRSFTILTETKYVDYHDTDEVARRTHQAVVYQAPAGNWVFNAGTFNWTHKLGTVGKTDPRVQRMTANLFARMLTSGTGGTVAAAKSVAPAPPTATVAPGYREPNQGAVPVATAGTGTLVPKQEVRSLAPTPSSATHYRDTLGHEFIPTQVGSRRSVLVTGTEGGVVRDYGLAGTRFISQGTQVRDLDGDGILEIVTQDSGGVPDSAAGGLIESIYRWNGSDYRVSECRRLVGESFQWLTYQPSAQGDCFDYPEPTQ